MSAPAELSTATSFAAVGPAAQRQEEEDEEEKKEEELPGVQGTFVQRAKAEQ
jgi:ribosomal protein L12E/L44/L45/RPP1/RPP2